MDASTMQYAKSIVGNSCAYNNSDDESYNSEDELCHTDEGFYKKDDLELESALELEERGLRKVGGQRHNEVTANSLATMTRRSMLKKMTME